LFDRQRSELSASPAAGDTAKSTSWTDARIHNTPWFRSLALLAAAAAAGSQTSLLSKQALAVLHLTSFGTWFGTVVYTTFVAGITMFKNLPRQTFGKLQAKLVRNNKNTEKRRDLFLFLSLSHTHSFLFHVLLFFLQFPKYFALSSVCLILQLVSLTILSPALRLASQKALAISLIMTLLNQFLLEPISTSNMMERYQLEQDNQQTSDRYVTLKKSFGKYHGMSSLTNLIALCGGVAHAVYLATSLVK
jgi:hypothetical protein